MNTLHKKQGGTTQGGFTIVETLVAITILMIAIAGPLTAAHRGLTAAVYARDQMVASYLAQDAMEYIKNVRNNNLLVDPARDWDVGFSDCTNVAPCRIDTISSDPTDIGTSFGIQLCGFSSCDELDTFGRLYLGSNGYYHPLSPTSGDIQTPYSRYFYISPLSDHEASLVVSVRWKNGTGQNDVTLRSAVFDILP